MTYRHVRLGAGDVPLARSLLAMFREAFEDEDYAPDKAPDDAYLNATLGDPACVVLAALRPDGTVAGGLVAYVLRKVEQARSEVFVYDLAVADACRRQGVASGLLAEVQRIGAAVGAHTVFIQAEKANTPAVALYTRLSCGVEPDVIHFDLPVGG